MGFLLRTGGGVGGLQVEECRALTTVCRADRDEVVVVHGDQLDRTFTLPPPGTPPDRLVTLAGRAFARHCGVRIHDGVVALWSDHGALCPLHYARDGAGGLVVATSAAALLPLLAIPVRLVNGPREVGRSGFAGVAAVPPGTLITAPVRGPGETEAGAYFRLPSPSFLAADQAVHEIGERLEQAVAWHLADHASAAILLSGGVDSSTVAALAMNRLPTLRSYTVGTPYGDEFAAASQLARHIGSAHEVLMFTPSDLARLLPRMVRLLETWDLDRLQILAPICFALEQLRGRESVVLTGYGADLLFAGLGGAGDDAKIEREIRAGVVATGCSNEFSPAFAEECGIVTRYPYWTMAMISAALSIPVSLKIRGQTVKWVLRRAAAGILPADIAFRAKVGIQEGTAMQRMFATVLGGDRVVQDARLRELAAAIFSDLGVTRSGPQEEENHARFADVAS